MMFIVRTDGERPSGSGFTVRLSRRSPLPAADGTVDFFCDGDPESVKDLPVIRVHDGWYADDSGGGVAIWGQGQFWEIRDTPFSVRETSADPSMASVDKGEGEVVNVRRAIFGV